LAWQSFTVQQQQALARQRQVAHRVSAEVAAFIQNLEDELGLVNQLYLLDELTQEQQNSLLSRIQSYEHTFKELTLLNSEGREVARASRLGVVAADELGSRAETGEFLYPMTTGKTYYGPVYVDKEIGEPSMTIAVPLFDLRSGQINGVLVADIRFKQIWDFLASLHLDEAESIYIVDDRGKVIAHREPSIALQNTHFSLPDVDGFQSGLDGAQVVMAVHELKLGDWTFHIVSEQAASTALALSIVTLTITGILLVLTLATAVGLGFLVVRQIVRPVQDLAIVAQKISAGDLSQRAKVNGNDELGVLAGAFNLMTAQLQKSIRDLERRVIELKQAETTLRKSEERYQSLFEHVPISLWEEDFSAIKQRIDELRAEGIEDFKDYFAGHPEAALQCADLVQVIDVNQATLEMYAAENKTDLLGSLERIFIAEAYQVFVEELTALAEGERQFHAEMVNLTLSEEKIIINLNLSIAPGYEDTWARVLVSITDITGRKQLEEQYRQSQKMEAVGQLAGGIAHDFNNILTAILGYATLPLLDDELPQNHPIRSDLQSIQKSAERAASLTRQLLAFARRQIISPEILTLNALILDMDKMLRRIIGEDVELVTLPAPNLGQVKADPSQLEQILLNLVVNARDAMPNGGILTIETANALLDVEYARQHAEVIPGEYAMLSVSDNGEGMTAEVKSRIFEPFFTTKETGKGSGLGLATCFGIVKQNNGHIWVYSEAGQGTTFKVYLPRVEEAADDDSGRGQSLPLPGGVETILLVEDEGAIRQLASRILREHGYTVLEAENGEKALRLIETLPELDIHLLLTDVVMPLMGGKGLAEQLRTTRPNLKVLFISGYTDNTVIHNGILEMGAAFLQKPFTLATLTRKVREVLDSPYFRAELADQP